MISRIQLVYIAISVTVSAFAAYGSVWLLLINLILLPIYFKRKDDSLTPILAVSATCISFFYFTSALPVVSSPGPTEVTFSWTENPKIDGNRIKGFVNTSDDKIYYTSYTFKDENEKTKYIALRFSSTVFTYSGSIKESVNPSHKYAFDMNKYLKMNGASGVFEAETLLSIKEHTNLSIRLSEQRGKLTTHIETKFPPSLVTEAKALLLGDRSGLDEEESSIYRRLGITHLFAISGLHVGLLIVMMREFLLRLQIRRGSVDLLLITLMPLYAVVVGGAPSVWRAVSVAVMALLLSLGGRKIRLDNALAVSAIVFIFLHPYIVFQPGFQLSYLAALALVLSSKILAKSKSFIGISFHVTAISQLALYPVLLIHFYELSLSSFFVNILFVPLYSIIILPVNILLLATTWAFVPLADLMFAIYVPFREIIRVATVWLSELPYQLWTPGKLGPIEATFAVAGVLYFFVKYEEGVALKYCLPFLLVPALVIQFLPYTNNSLQVTYLDVGQGDSIVIELPFRKAVYVIDTGGTVDFFENDWKSPMKRFEVGRNIVVPFLKGQGITKVDKLILTHPHADHIEGADEVLEELRVKEIHITPGSETESEMDEVLKIATSKVVPIYGMRDEVSWEEGIFKFAYVSPQEGMFSLNDRSLALFMMTPELNFLFTGDMEKEAEINFINKYTDVDFGRIILKAGHHGSKTSSTESFINKLHPELTIFSAGRGNMYGHPHEEVMERFDRLNLPTMSTAEYGSITIKVEQGAYSISTMTQ
ncbi:DNA internalization-related competence protein ComEC/Rec2 [Sporosarcina sp. CAU 1771]